MFKIIKVNLKKRHALVIPIKNKVIFKVYINKKHKQEVTICPKNSITTHKFKVEVNKIHKIKTIVCINNSIKNNIIELSEWHILKFKVIVQSSKERFSDFSTKKEPFKVSVPAVHRMVCNIGGFKWSNLNTFRVQVSRDIKIKLELCNVVLEKDCIVIRNLGVLNGDITPSFLIKNRITSKFGYNNLVNVVPLKFVNLQINNNSIYKSTIMEHAVRRLNVSINNIDHGVSKMDLSSNHLDITINDTYKYTDYINANLYVDINDWKDVTYAFPTWRDVFENNDRWRDLLKGLPVNNWKDLFYVYDTWEEVLQTYERWLDLIEGSNEIVSIDNKYIYASDIKSLVTGINNAIRESALFTNSIKEGLGYGIYGYEFYTHRSKASVGIKVLNIKTWSDLLNRYDTWKDVFTTYNIWRDIIDTEILNNLSIVVDTKYSSYILRSVIGLIESIKANNYINNILSESVSLNAKINNDSNMITSLNLDIEYTPIMSWQDVITKASTWNDVKNRYDTWHEMSIYAITRRLYIENYYTYANHRLKGVISVHDSSQIKSRYENFMSASALLNMRLLHNNSMEDNMIDKLASNARMISNSTFNSQLDVNIEHNPVMSWDDLITRAASWGDIRERYSTWEEMSIYAITHRLYIENYYSYSLHKMSALAYLETAFSNQSTGYTSVNEKWLSYTSFNSHSSAGSIIESSYRLNGSFIARYRYADSMNISIENVIRPTWQLVIDRYNTWNNVSYSFSTWQDVYNFK